MKNLAIENRALQRDRLLATEASTREVLLYQEDSGPFYGDPSHKLTLNHGFPVIWLCQPKKFS